MSNFPNAEQYIEQLAQELELPYIEVLAFRENEQLLHKTIKAPGQEGRDKLFLYSLTKPVTAACALQLVERGLLSLNDPLTKYIPAFADSFYVDGEGQRHVVGSEITIFHLLTMSAGFSYDIKVPALQPLFSEGSTATTRQVADAIAGVPLQFRPGERFLYSLCMDVMGAVIEVASGQSFASYVKENIFTPLGMDRSGFSMDDEAHMLPLHISNPDGIAPAPLVNEYTRSPNFHSGGAGIIGTAEDFGKFAVALANGGLAANGHRILSPESVARMHRVEVSVQDINRKFSCIQGKDYSYGLGVRTRIVPTEWGLGAGEFGWDGAAGSYLMVDPERHISLVIGLHMRDWWRIFKEKHLAIVEQVYRELKQ